MAVWIKVCGITCVEDARVAVELGVDAIGLNFVQGSPRHIDPEAARRIADAVGEQVEVVAVVAGAPAVELRELRRRTGAGWLQLHGDETPDDLAGLLPGAYKAVRIRDARDVAAASRYGGERLLVDAKVDGQLGGTGHRFDWRLVGDLVQTRPVILAGGLTPDNVAAAVREVAPWGVDVASGVERPADRRRKDPAALERFVAMARGAS